MDCRLEALYADRRSLLAADKLVKRYSKTLNRAIKRNHERFSSDFMFQLTEEGFNSLRYQFGTLSPS